MSSKLENAQAALVQLQSFLGEPVLTDRDRAGVIQAFEFTFEATWKLFKYVAEGEGLEAASPRRAVTSAYQLGYVTNEDLWLQMLRDRNLTSHVYHLEVAASIFEAVERRYAEALAEAVAKVAKGLAT